MELFIELILELVVEGAAELSMLRTVPKRIRIGLFSVAMLVFVVAIVVFVILSYIVPSLFIRVVSLIFIGLILRYIVKFTKRFLALQKKLESTEE